MEKKNSNKIQNKEKTTKGVGSKTPTRNKKIEVSKTSTKVKKTVQPKVQVEKKQISPEKKRENRSKLFRAVLTLLCFALSFKVGQEISLIRHDKDREEQKNLFIIENSFLVRDKDFLTNGEYQRNYLLLQKEMIAETGGLNFNGKKMEEE